MFNPLIGDVFFADMSDRRGARVDGHRRVLHSYGSAVPQASSSNQCGSGPGIGGACAMSLLLDGIRNLVVFLINRFFIMHKVSVVAINIFCRKSGIGSSCACGSCICDQGSLTRVLELFHPA